MDRREKRKKQKEQERRIRNKKHFQKSVNEAISKCSFCGIKDKNTVFYNGLGFCTESHLELWKEKLK